MYKYGRFLSPTAHTLHQNPLALLPKPELPQQLLSATVS
jgi:hypothetical protein